MNIFLSVEKLIQQFLLQQQLTVEFDVFTTRRLKYGHISSNVMMKIQTKYRHVAIDVLQNGFHHFIRQTKVKWLAQLVFTGGFANFTIQNSALCWVVDTILQQPKDYGRGSPKPILYKVEIISANPTGYLHVGHVRNGLIGDSVGRILAFLGYQVWQQYYLNDSGRQVQLLAQTVIWHYEQLCREKPSTTLPADYYQGEVYRTIAKQIFAQDRTKHLPKPTAGKISFFQQQAVGFFLTEIKNNLQQIDIKIDEFIAESAVIQNPAMQVLQQALQSQGLMFEREKAWWFKATQFGEDKDRVLIKSNGDYTYFLPDLVGHWLKFQSPAGQEVKVLDFWGADHHSYAQRMTSALAQLPGIKIERFEVIISAMVLLTQAGETSKISKRQGTGIWFQDLFKVLGADLMRFIFCSKASSNHLKINLAQLTVNSVQNPFFYWQYAVVRCCSLFMKLKEHPRLKRAWQTTVVQLEEPLAITLMLKLSQFPQLVRQAGKLKTPHLVCDYGHQLAALLHEYYTRTTIIDPQQRTLSCQRLKLVAAVRCVLVIALSLLGIKPKTRM